MERFADEVCALLPNDKRLYDAVSMAITFGKSMSVPMSQDLKEKFEVDTQKNCLEQKIKEDIELDGVTTTHSVEKTDGLETVDLDAYTDHVDHDIETGDTVDASLREDDLLTQEFNNAGEQTPSDDTVHQAVDAIDHNEPDLDTTLIADEIGEHSETDTNPLASSSQTSLVDANTDTNTPLINGDDVNQFKIDSSPNSSQIQESSNSNVTEINPFPETSPAVELPHIVRSKSKAIPHQSNSETTASHSDVRMGPNSWTPDSATNSLISDSSSLPKLSLEEIPTLDQQSSSLDKQVHPEMASSQGSDTSHSFKRSFSQTVDKPVNPESMKPLPLARRGSMPDFANRVQMVDFKHSVSLDDDVIAVRVSSNSGTKNKSRKKSRRKKTSSPVSSVGKGATLETGGRNTHTHMHISCTYLFVIQCTYTLNTHSQKPLPLTQLPPPHTLHISATFLKKHYRFRKLVSPHISHSPLHNRALHRRAKASLRTPLSLPPLPKHTSSQRKRPGDLMLVCYSIK